MLLISSVGATLIAMSYLEKRGRISINHNILYLLISIIIIWMGIWGLGVMDKTFLLNISR